MQINELPVTSTFNDSTVFPVENGNVTSQVSGATLKAAMIDGAITSLPSVAAYDDDIEFAVASEGVTSKMTGAVLRSAFPTIKSGEITATTDSQYGSVTVYFDPNDHENNVFSGNPAVTGTLQRDYRGYDIYVALTAPNYVTFQFTNTGTSTYATNKVVKFYYIAVG